MKKILLTLFTGFSTFAVFAQPTVFVGCPNINTAILRSGTNSPNSGPISIYNVNTATGAPTLLSGPILDPANTSLNLQINGVGLNTVDGFMYVINSGTPTIPFSFPIIPKMPFYRLGANAVAVQLGTLAGPSISGLENSSVVSAAAGETDLSGTYYFSAATGVAVPNIINPAASTFTVSRLFIGQLTNIAGLGAGSSALSPTYVQVTNPSNDALVYLSNVQASSTLSTAQNTGLRDFVFNKYDGCLYAYVTFPDPSNPGGNFYGQMLKVNPSTGILTALAPAVILPFATASNEVAGTLLDKAGNFLILFTDGKMYKAGSSAMGVFDGSISLLNGATGLPTALRGDMASCGATADGGTLPVIFSDFTAFKQNEGISLKWQSASEINAEKFIVQKSIDAINWKAISNIAARGVQSNGAQYMFVDNNFDQTVYYRLACVDKNGEIRYSSVKKIVYTAAKLSISLYPNPVKNILTIEGQQVFGTNTNITITDVTGKMLNIASKKIKDNMIYVDVTNLSKGVYFLRLNTETGVASTNRFVKQ
jgi:hypothetical protein